MNHIPFEVKDVFKTIFKFLNQVWLAVIFMQPHRIQYNSLVITEHHTQPAIVFSQALYKGCSYVTYPGLPAPVALQKD